MKHKNLERYFHTPTVPLEIDDDKTVAGLLRKMQRISFQGRSLAEAYEVWKKMLEDRTTIFMGLAGAMVAGAMRRLVVYLITMRFIDCLVTTGANAFHDVHETIGRLHYQGSHNVNDEELQDLMIDRMYDTYCSEEEFRDLDASIGEFIAKLDQARPYPTREFFYLLGKEISAIAKEDGIVTAAYKAKVPIYCPAIADSSYGIAIASHRFVQKNNFTFDVIQDVVETAQIAAQSECTGVIYFGGGTPKNFIQQSEVTASVVRANVHGHKYALQIITDAAHWGGLSGCTFEEAQSWGKIAKGAAKVTVHCDSTIAMPILVTALSQEAVDLAAKRHKPKFELGKEFRMNF